MQNEGFIVIDNWLSKEKAEDIADRIERIQDWDARICDRDGGPRIIESSIMRSLGMTAEEFAKSYPESLEALARGGTMAYLFFVKHLSVFDEKLHSWFNNDFLKLANELSEQQNNYIEEPQVTMYSSGCFLGQHSDGVGFRNIAFIANFTRNWQPDFGGCLTICHKGKWTVIPAKFNSLTLMDVRAGNCHYVSQVSSWVKQKRIAITGWVGDKGK